MQERQKARILDIQLRYGSHTIRHLHGAGDIQPYEPRAGTENAGAIWAHLEPLRGVRLKRVVRG